MAEHQSPTLSWIIAGKRVDVDLGDVTGLEWRAARVVSGLRQNEIYRMAIEGDFEAVGALAWIAGRRENPALSYEEVLGGLTLNSVDLADPVPEEESDPPG